MHMASHQRGPMLQEPAMFHTLLKILRELWKFRNGNCRLTLVLLP